MHGVQRESVPDLHSMQWSTLSGSGTVGMRAVRAFWTCLSVTIPLGSTQAVPRRRCGWRARQSSQHHAQQRVAVLRQGEPCCERAPLGHGRLCPGDASMRAQALPTAPCQAWSAVTHYACRICCHGDAARPPGYELPVPPGYQLVTSFCYFHSPPLPPHRLSSSSSSSSLCTPPPSPRPACLFAAALTISADRTSTRRSAEAVP